MFSDPSTVSGIYNDSIWYYEAWVDLQGRGIRRASFRGTRLRIVGTTPLTTDGSSKTFPYIGRESEDHVYDYATSTYTSETLWDWVDKTLSSAPYQQRYFPYASPITDYRYELGEYENGQNITTTETQYTYDNYGNALTIDKTVTDNDPDSPYLNDTWTTNITNTPDVDTTHWCLTLLSGTQAAYTASIGGSVTRTLIHLRRTRPTVTTQRLSPSRAAPTTKVTETLGYDSFGNVSSDAVAGVNAPHRRPLARRTTIGARQGNT